MGGATSPNALRRSSPTSGVLIAIVDSGPLYAVIDLDDRHHEEASGLLSRTDLQLVVPAFVVAETAYLVGRWLGPTREAQFLRGMAELDVEAPAIDDWPRIAELVDEYADFPLGGADASVIALAERLGARLVLTLDRRHFGAVRPRHLERFDLLPA